MSTLRRDLGKSAAQDLPADATLEWTTYWRSAAPLASAAFLLHLDAYDGTQRRAFLANTGVHRDTSLLRPLCVAPYAAARVEPAALYIAPGLGRGVAARLRYVNGSKYSALGDGAHDGTPSIDLPAADAPGALYAQAGANYLGVGRGCAARLLAFLLVPRTATPTSLRVALSAHISQERANDANVDAELARALAADDAAARRRDPLHFTAAFRSWCSAAADSDGPHCVLEQHYAATGGAYFADVTLTDAGDCPLADYEAALAYIARVTGAPVPVVSALGFVDELCAFAAARVRPGQRHFGLGFVALKHSTRAPRFDENLGAASKSFVWLDAVASSLTR